MKLKPAISAIVLTFALGAHAADASATGAAPSDVARHGLVTQGIQFNGPLLQGLQLNGPILQGMRLNGPLLQGVQFNGPLLQGVQFNGPMLQGVVLNGPYIHGAPLQERLPLTAAFDAAGDARAMYGVGQGVYPALATASDAVPGHSLLSGLDSRQVRIRLIAR